MEKAKTCETCKGCIKLEPMKDDLEELYCCDTHPIFMRKEELKECGCECWIGEI